MAVGEHLGYSLTGVWTLLTGVAAIQSTTVPAWIGVIGILIGGALVVCALEFVGPFERSGWNVAARLTPLAYVAWSLWLIATGVALLA